MQAYYEPLTMKVKCKRRLCFANNFVGYCTILLKPAERKDGSCPFYKTNEEFLKGQEKYGGIKE